mmetsp:Transcript_5490/g.11334  ORF Transcript_5490/g.11334 Transcript_5490/m.11334 type:complete len:105 (+) Transcript_5490:620-934(+)
MLGILVTTARIIWSNDLVTKAALAHLKFSKRSSAHRRQERTNLSSILSKSKRILERLLLVLILNQDTTISCNDPSIVPTKDARKRKARPVACCNRNAMHQNRKN